MLVLLLLPVPILCGVFGWVGSSFLDGEYIHQSMMAYDRGLDLTWHQRSSIGILWLPFLISGSLWVWLFLKTMRHSVLRMFWKK
jgi:hypothetical protein